MPINTDSQVVRHRDGRFISYRRGEIWVASMDDQSPQHRHWEHGNRITGYHPDCSLCWLGFGHSQILHAEKVKDL